MNYIKQHIIPMAIAALGSFVVYILLSIFSDMLPVLLPSLKEIAVVVYIKMILLLIAIILILVLIICAIINKSKPHKPRAMSGKFHNIEWSAEIEYREGREYRDVRTHIVWLCPKYKTPLSLKQMDAPNAKYHTLYCSKCKKTHDVENKGEIIPAENADMTVRREILKNIDI